MKDIFKNAYFGKAYKTRDGRKAIYITCANKDFNFYPHTLIQDGFTSYYYYNDSGKVYVDYNTLKYDIVSEWKEDKYDKITQEVKNDVINKAYEWWKFEMKTSCPDGIYQSWCQHTLEKFKRAMEE